MNMRHCRRILIICGAVAALGPVHAWEQFNGTIEAPNKGFGPPAVIAPDGKYLGDLSANPYAPNSISNEYGRYGSPYSPDSINNPYGEYGSRYSPKSPNNPYAPGYSGWGR
jgi:hypothetical protein